MARINGVRYERQLIRIKEGVEVDGVATKHAEKYEGGASTEAVSNIRNSIKRGDTWIFELAPRSR